MIKPEHKCKAITELTCIGWYGGGIENVAQCLPVFRPL
jgi:hypothetical protein